MVTELDVIRAATSEDKLLERATMDAIAAMMQHTIGLTVPAAIIRLDQLREEFEKARPHDRPRAILRIRLRRP